MFTLLCIYLLEDKKDSLSLTGETIRREHEGHRRGTERTWRVQGNKRREWK